MSSQTIFLTSSFLPYQGKKEYQPMPLLSDNGFVTRLGHLWKAQTKFLVFSSDPDETADARAFVEQQLLDAFQLSDLPIGEIRTFDHNSSSSIHDLLAWADVLYLAGGHAPTQNRFMQECSLRDKLQNFDGIILGLSAGSANSAENVYLFPELPGESSDPSFNRSAKGLGLTDLQIMPHGQYFVPLQQDGQSVYKDILLPDSHGRCIYVIPDGSYFMIKDGITEFFGEGTILKDGEVFPLHSGIVSSIDKTLSDLVLDHLLPESYAFVFLIDERDESLHFLYINDAFRNHSLQVGEMLCYSQFIPSLAAYVVPEEQDAFQKQTEMNVVLDELSRFGGYVRTVHLQTTHGRTAEGIRIRRLNPTSPYLLGTSQDIEAIIDHDWMTDEFARSGFIQAVNRFLGRTNNKEQYSLVYTNIKGFKAINELFGQQSGDIVIFRERDVLRSYLQPEIMARLESEHFALICKNEYLTKDNLAPLELQIYTQAYKQYHYSIRLGIYPLCEEDVTVDDMLDRAKLAEKALADTERIFYKRYDDALRQKYMDKNILLSDMKDGLRNHQFVVYYQPIVNIKTGEICSAEALVRWNHPQYGILTPGRFIPIFESGDEISRLDYYIFRQVLDMEKSRLEQDKPVVPVAINLSRIDFYDPTFMSAILDNINLLDLTYSPINIEVTESSYYILENSEIDFLNKMKQSGIKILLDDYGSGMSSLSTLESFAFNILKLDMGFIRKIGISQKAEAIIKSTIALSHALGAKVTAEGVETKEQLDFLKQADCDMIQGYYYYKPMPQDQFEALLDG